MTGKPAMNVGEMQLSREEESDDDVVSLVLCITCLSTLLLCYRVLKLLASCLSMTLLLLVMWLVLASVY